jgi:serine O-acetyltransferase
MKIFEFFLVSLLLHLFNLSLSFRVNNVLNYQHKQYLGISNLQKRRILASFATSDHSNGVQVFSPHPSREALVSRLTTLKQEHEFDDPKNELTKKLWEIIKEEAKAFSKDDFRTSSLIFSSLLMENSLEEVLIDYIANQLDTVLIPSTQIRNIFSDLLLKNSSILSAWTADLLTTILIDHSTQSLTHSLLFNKGYHSLVAYRIAHHLWYDGRDSLARYFQSIISRKFGSDVHPACSIGKGVYFSEGSDVIVGETASVGNHCCFMHGITLGGTGKESGNRHPKLGNYVFLGIGASILGNIPIGNGAIINTGSVVTKPVEEWTRVGGIPAKLICKISQKPTQFNEALQSMITLGNHADTDSCVYNP